MTTKRAGKKAVNPQPKMKTYIALQKLPANRRAELARLSRTLSGLRTDIELGWNLKSFRCDPPR